MWMDGWVREGDHTRIKSGTTTLLRYSVFCAAIYTVGRGNVIRSFLCKSYVTWYRDCRTTSLSGCILIPPFKPMPGPFLGHVAYVYRVVVLLSKHRLSVEGLCNCRSGLLYPELDRAPNANVLQYVSISYGTSDYSPSRWILRYL